MAAEEDPGAAQRNALHTLRQRRPITKDHRRAIDQLWRSDIKRWLEGIGLDVTKFKGMSLRDRRELKAWFNALDMDQSGSVEEGEIRALMDAMGVSCSRAMLVQLFGSIDKELNAELTLPEFMKLMIMNADMLVGAASTSATSHNGLFDDNTRLMMLAYRRQRLLDDVADPTKRHGAPETGPPPEEPRGQLRPAVRRLSCVGQGLPARRSSVALEARRSSVVGAAGGVLGAPADALPRDMAPTSFATSRRASVRPSACGCGDDAPSLRQTMPPLPPISAAGSLSPRPAFAKSIPSWDATAGGAATAREFTRPQPPPGGASLGAPSPRRERLVV